MFNTIHKKRKLAASVSLMVLFAHAAVSHAQTAEQVPTGADKGGLADIVVTAQKRAESLSKTAAAISVIGQQTLDNVGARSFTDAVKTLPSVSTGIGGTLAIRGLGTSTLGQTNGTVAYHVDGIFQNSLQQSGAALFDVGRIEVLRGPQGTLYGRNATAGVVNVLTNNANPDAFEAFGDVSYGNWNTLNLRGAVNVPLSDTFAVRLTGTYENSDDWKRFANGHHPRSKDVLNMRLAWHAEPSDSITWDARVAFTDNKSLQGVATPSYIYNATTNTYTPASNPRELAAIPSNAGRDGLDMFGFGLFPSVYKGLSYEEANTRHQRSIAFRSNLNFELSDTLSLTYLLGYSYEKQYAPTVISGLQPFQVNYAKPTTNGAWSHEVDLNYQSDKLKAIFGLYSFQNVSKQPDSLTRVFLPSVSSTNFVDFSLPLLDVNGGSGDEKVTTRAVFGQATVDLTDSFRVTGGARYNWDHVRYQPFTTSQCPFGSGLDAANPDVARFSAGNLLGFPAGAPLCSTLAFTGLEAFDPSFVPGFFYVNKSFAGGAKQFKKFSWKASAEYDLSADTMLYATVATGYKAGGTADRTQVGDARFYRPETNINYEMGVRSKLFDNTLSLNLTAFWTDYKDLQIQTTNPSVPGALLAVNAGKSRSRGIELEYAWAPTSADRINGYVTYLDAKFRDFPGVDPLTEVAQNFAGNRLPGAPKFAGRISYSHIFDLGDAGTITPTAQFYYQSKSYVLFTNTLATLTPDYTRSDLIVRYETANKRVSVEGYVNNIENKMILGSIFPFSGISNAFYSPPRSYGVRVGFRY